MEDRICINEYPVCVHNEFCGGCIYQELTYDEQRILKGREVLRLMNEKGVDLTYLERPFVPEDIIGAPKIYRYRNKMEYTFGDLVKDGEMTLGMHKKGNFMSIITVDGCQIVDEDFNLVLKSTLDFCNERGYDFYHKKSHKGLLRNLIVRKGERTGELLVNIVTSSQSEFDEQGYADMIYALPLKNVPVGVLRTLNDNIADAVNADGVRVLRGRDYYNEKVMGLDFKVSAFSFFQTNVEAAERLYKDALAMLPDFDGQVAFDLFCGTGTITQALATKAKKAVGVEIVEEAVMAAKENAKLNGLDNCEFIAGDVFDVLDGINEKPDVIVVDPPRMGILPKTIDKILNYGINEILYISCNPRTLAENIKYMEYYGYKAVKMKAYDNFPMTKHVETIVLLSNKSPASIINAKVEFGEGEGKVPLDAIV